VNIGQIDAGREELVGGAHPKKRNKKMADEPLVSLRHHPVF
jgi:hypothetical protein